MDPSRSYVVIIILDVEKVIIPRSIALHSVVDHQTRVA